MGLLSDKELVEFEIAIRAMRSPVFVIVAELTMQHIEDQSLSTFMTTPPFFLRYVDDILTALPSTEINNCLLHLNNIDHHIQFTVENEDNNQISFLDSLITRNNNILSTTVYRKSTHTDRLLDFRSYHPSSHKATTVQNLYKRAELICTDQQDLIVEKQHLENIFHKNNYPPSFIARNRKTTHSPKTSTTNTFICLPYIQGTSETISRILQNYNFSVAHKPQTTIRNLLMNVKDKTDPIFRQGSIYRIPCQTCEAAYIGETGRSLSIRIKEHKTAIRRGNITSSTLANHHLETGHQIDWEKATCLIYNNNSYQRLILESWFTVLEKQPLNYSLNLPTCFKPLINSKNK